MKILNKLNKTKIVATMGPTFGTENIIKKMLLSGVTTVRLNTSHGDYDEHETRIKLVKKVRKELDLPISIMLDTKGPEIRVHAIENKKMNVKRGVILKIHSKKEIIGKNNEFSVTYTKLADSVLIGSNIMIDDGKLILEVQKINKVSGVVIVKSLNNHYIGSKKSVNIPGIDLCLPFLGKRDKDFIKWGIKHGINIVAASFVREGKDVTDLRNFLDANGGKNVMINSKIEALKAIQNLNDIIKASDSIMIARGDLGVEIPYYDVPFYTQLLINKARAWNKPVIVATQMLDSMIDNPSPTRAEVTDVYYSTLLGADSTMLSGESASGDFPLEAVQTMNQINKSAEENFNYVDAYNMALAIAETNNAQTAYLIAKEVLTKDIKYIIAFSEKGRLLKALSSFRTSVPIFGMLKDKSKIYDYGITYGVYPQAHATQSDFKSDVKINKIAKDLNLKKDVAVIVANKNEFRIIRIK